MVITVTSFTLAQLIAAGGGAQFAYAKRLKRGFWVGGIVYESEN